MKKIILQRFLMLIIIAVSATSGLVIGALIGGNFATQVDFNGVQGYEATGQIGLIAGSLIGLVASVMLSVRKK